VNAIDPDGNFLWFVAVGAYYAWSVYDSYRDVQTLRSTSASREDKAWAAIGLIGSVVPGGKAAKIIKKGSKTYKVLRHAKFKKAYVKKLYLGSWSKGSFGSAKQSAIWHFKKHGAEVGAKDVEQYIRKAEQFARNLRGAKKSKVRGSTEGVTRYKKNGKYVDLAPNGSIVSFGKL
jgi:hypothetical protein